MYPKMIFLDPDAPFFCNFNGGQLSAIRNTSGSLWDIFGKETGLDHVTVNTLRRGAEDHVQKNQVSRKRVGILQGHSEDVGLDHYDRGSADYRSSFIHELSQIEGSCSKTPQEDLSEPVAAKRAKIDEDEINLRSEIVESKTKKTTKAKYNVCKSQKLMPNDREFLQKLLSDQNYKHLHKIDKKKSFPGDKYFVLLLFNAMLLMFDAFQGSGHLRSFYTDSLIQMTSKTKTNKDCGTSSRTCSRLSRKKW